MADEIDISQAESEFLLSLMLSQRITVKVQKFVSSAVRVSRWHAESS